MLTQTIAAFVTALSLATGALAEPIKYILDTDIASDCDDAGAVAMVNALIDNGEVDVLAMMVCTGGRYGAPALSAINTWYGHGDIPIGTIKNPKFWVGGDPAKPSGAYNYESYNRHLAEHFPTALKDGNDAPDARELYRKILAGQPDGSVVINTIGPLGNLALLLQTPADAHSPMNGMDLVRAKVKTLVITGGRNPEGTSSNFSKEDAEQYTKPVIDTWPTPIVFVGNEIGGKIMTSWRPNAAATVGNPARVAYQQFYKGDDTKSHHSSDQAGILYAIRGNGELFTLVDDGHQTCDDTGKTKWVTGTIDGKRHAYLRKRDGVDQTIGETCEALMTQGRKATK